MYEGTRKELENLRNNPQTGNTGQQQHIAVTATLANISADLVEEVAKLRQTIVKLDSQNQKLTFINTLLSIFVVLLTLVQIVSVLKNRNCWGEKLQII